MRRHIPEKIFLGLHYFPTLDVTLYCHGRNHRNADAFYLPSFETRISEFLSQFLSHYNIKLSDFVLIFLKSHSTPNKFQADIGVHEPGLFAC
jgi:hypothetical protein